MSTTVEFDNARHEIGKQYFIYGGDYKSVIIKVTLKRIYVGWPMEVYGQAEAKDGKVVTRPLECFLPSYNYCLSWVERKYEELSMADEKDLLAQAQRIFRKQEEGNKVKRLARKNQLKILAKGAFK